MKTYQIISAEDPKSIIAESYRRLQVNIEFSQTDREIKTIAMTSTTQSEGKSITLLNLATVYAEGRQKVILIDLDLRRPRVHRGLQVKNEGGLVGYLNGEVSRENLILKTQFGFDAILSGKSVSAPTLLLKSTKLQTLLDELKKEYDYIFIDTPPAGIVTDPFIIAQFCDGLIYTVAANRTKRDVIRETIKELKNNGANIIGINLTKAHYSDVRTQKYYYKEYYEDRQTDE